MLKLALKAQLPLIACHTRDPVNFPDVLKFLAGKKVYPIPKDKFEPGMVYYSICNVKTETLFGNLYASAAKAECTIVIVNPKIMELEFYDAGEVPIPKEMLSSTLEQVTDDKDKSASLMLSLGGVTLKESVEFSLLTMAKNGSLTQPGLMETRLDSFQGQKGLTIIDTKQTLYVPHSELEAYIQKERAFFLNEPDHRLRPRGLLADGMPGTGKTAGAKYLAEQWGVPLYRFDIGGTKNKYVGDSEGNMLNNLARLDQEEPAVVLFDEIEKIFSADGSYGDSGTTTTMLSQLLWWLAEHKSRVFAFMTTNAASKLPKELYRQGRVDKTMVFKGLDKDDAVDFVKSILSTFEGFSPAPALMVARIIKSATQASATVAVGAGEGKSENILSQAILTNTTYEHIKEAKAK